jgi:ATP adenylyltransferase
MDALWAPWRMDYIKGEREEGCFLCRMLSEDRDEDNLVLFRGGECAVVMNRYPYNNGHLMITPRRHLRHLRDLTASEQAALMALTSRSVEVLRDAVNAEGFNVGLNLGRCAGAGLEDHLHVHVVPRWAGDTNFMPVLGETKVIPQALADVYRELAPRFRAASTPTGSA